MNKIFLNNIGDLAETQRASFYRFLSSGISEELISFPNPFFSYFRTLEQKTVPGFIYLYPSEIKLKGPNLNMASCLKRNTSYTIGLYVTAEYTYLEIDKNSDDIISPQAVFDFLLKKNFTSLEKKDQFSNNEKLIIERSEEIIKKLPKKEIRLKQDIFFGEIPLMTEEGTFIINGCERVVISQIIRSPGVYFRKEFAGSSKKKVNYTATVISNKGLWTKFTLDDYPNEKGEISPIKDRIYIKLNEFRRQTDIEYFETKFEALKTNKDKIFIFDLIKFFGLKLGEVIDSLKYLNHIKTQQIKNEELDAEDNILLIKKLFLNYRSGGFSIGEIGRYKINKKLGIHLPKTIHYLTAHDFLGIIDGLIELKYYDRPNDDIDDIKNKLIRCIGDLLQNQIRIGLYRLQKTLENPFQLSKKKTFKSYAISSEQWNAWILDPRPITNSFKDFFITSQLSQYMDQINPLSELTHKRRISVFGPNGLKRDHISNVIRDIHPSQYGRLCPIETPEGQNAGLIHAIAMYGRISSLGTIETPYFLINKGKVYSEKYPIFLNPEQESTTRIAFCDISVPKTKEITQKYLSIKENYSFSVKKKEEVNFITTSPLQIISLGTALIPFLEHDDANRALMGSNMQRQAVPLLYPKKTLVGTGFESSTILDSGMIIKTYCEGIVESSSSGSIQIIDNSGQKINYFLKKNFRSNQETSMNQRPIVWVGEKVFSGQVIADGPSTVDGELALGRNLLVGYMPWEGYNYEDAIVINERLILDDCLTSIHIEECETNLTYCLLGNEKLTRKLPQLTKHVRRNLNSDGIIKIGSFVHENDVLVGKLTPYQEDPSPEIKLLKTLYPQLVKKKNYRDTSLRVAPGTEGRVVDIRFISTVLINQNDPSLPTSSEIIRIYIAQIRKIQVGDKLAGRHGNKGIISRILPAIDMPYLPDGTPLDIILNPLGVPSRMNVGQVFECLLGFAGEKLGQRFIISPFDEIYGKEASRILVNQKLKQAALEKNEPWIFHPIYPGKVLLRDGRTGEFFDNPITIGKSYILKLIHLVEDKIHARSTGPYAMITEQPLSGKAQKGGQRFGEMEVWALEAFGCANTLQELLTVKSDDIDGRNDMHDAILRQNDTEKPKPSIPESFLTLIRELNALGLDFSLHKMKLTDEITNVEETEKDVFKEIELRLKLRTQLARYKAEFFSKPEIFKEKIEKNYVNKIIQKKEALENYKKIHSFPKKNTH